MSLVDEPVMPTPVTLRSWLTEEQALDDRDARYEALMDKAVRVLGEPGSFDERRRLFKAVRQADDIFDTLVGKNYWLPTPVVNQMALRLDLIDSQAREMILTLAKAAMVPLTLPVATIRPMHLSALHQPSEEFDRAIEDPHYPRLNAAQYIEVDEGLSYYLRLEVRARGMLEHG